MDGRRTCLDCRNPAGHQRTMTLRALVGRRQQEVTGGAQQCASRPVRMRDRAKAQGPRRLEISENSGNFLHMDTSGCQTRLFLARLKAGGSGIFTGPGPIADRVIAVGDPLDGSQVTGLLFNRFGLNDSGSIAFWAILADGRTGIYEAVVPEPSSIVLLGLGVGSVVLYARCRRVSAGSAHRT